MFTKISTILYGLLAAIFIGNSVTAAQTAGKPLALPARYDAHRFYVEPVTISGEKLVFFTDTGGALFLFADTVEHLKIAAMQIEADGGRKMEVVSLPAFKPESFIPAPLGSPNEKLLVAPLTQRLALAKDWSGMLGQQWFANRVWTFDYLNQKLLLRANSDVPKVAAAHRIALGFKTNSAGKRSNNFPRITITIDGENLDLLFDTGASTELTATARAAVKDSLPNVRATSFIAANVFQKWREKHPEWRVIEAAENGTNEAMIEVPKVSIGGYTIEKIWFTRRPDKNFHEFMSQWTDKPIEGAIGGNALRFFRVTVDYPNATAIFER